MSVLPPHIAADGEEIPKLRDRQWAGPDMRAAMPVDQMLRQLSERDDDDVGYLELWRLFVTSIGCSVSITFERDGDVGLSYGAPCDSQTRHRSRWMHFLFEDLDRVETRRICLMRQLNRNGPRCDKRRTDPRATTIAMRAFIRAGGRILITPDGQIEDKSPVMRDVRDVTAEQRDRALHEYFDVRTRLRSDAQIKRAARLLGTATENGWLVLEAAR